MPDRTNVDLRFLTHEGRDLPDRAGGNLRCPDRIEREVHARYGAVDNVRRIDAWREWHCASARWDGAPSRSTRTKSESTRRAKLDTNCFVAMVVTSMTQVVKIE